MKKVTYQAIRELIPPTNPSKIARVLHHLATGNTLNSIQAETELNEHSLPSTISTLKNKYGFEIIRTDRLRSLTSLLSVRKANVTVTVASQ